jgi:phospholipid/cholesterol/gamma-HCH transport system permease protein
MRGRRREAAQALRIARGAKYKTTSLALSPTLGSHHPVTDVLTNTSGSLPNEPEQPAGFSPLRIVRGTVGRLGAWVTHWLSYGYKVATLAGYGFHRLSFGMLSMRRVTFDVMVRQILFTGVEALPFTGLIATLVGLSVVLQAQLQLSAGDADLLGKLLVYALVRELGPLVSSLIIIGRSGTAVVVELANMRVSREIDTLESLGIDVFEYLVVPRIGGVVVSIFCVSMFFVVVSLLTGLVGGIVLSANSMTALEFIDVISNNLRTVDGVLFVLKTVPPAMMIASIACLEGLTAGPDITDVPRAATRGTVTGITALFVWNAGVSALAYGLL